MRRVIFWFGWAILIALPIVFAVQVFMIQDLPKIQPWKWAIPAVAVLMIFFARNRDEVFNHHIAH
jgi:hypothetical protein